VCVLICVVQGFASEDEQIQHYMVYGSQICIYTFLRESGIIKEWSVGYYAKPN